MKQAISIIFFFYTSFNAPSSWAANSRSPILNPELTPGKFVLVFEEYEDQRFDFDLDGKIDFWRLKKDDLRVDIKFQHNGIDELSIKKYWGDRVTEILYRLDGNRLVLITSENRKNLIMNFSEGDKCPSSKEHLEKELRDFKDFQNLISESTATNLISAECQEKLGEEGYSDLATALLKFLEGTDKITKCINNPDFKKVFKPGKETDLNVEILKTSYALERAKLTRDNSKYSPLISCKKVNERRGVSGISTKENGNIEISIADNAQAPEIKSEQLNHELLHRIGFYSETSVKKIVTSCNDLGKAIAAADKEEDKEKQKPCITPASIKEAKLATVELANSSEAKTADAKGAPNKVANNTGTETAKASAKAATTTTKSEVYKSAVNAGADTSANIPKSMTLAQTKVPSSEALSETIYTNHQKTDTGISNAYAKSTSQSSGILATANNIAGAMNTPAAASLAQAKNQIREIASTAQATGTTNAVAKNGSTGGLIARNKIGADETVVESITLDSQKPAVTARADASSSQVQNSRQPASESRSLPSAAETSGNTPQAAGLNSPRSDSGTAQVNPIGSNQQVSLGAGNQNTQRQPANVVRSNGSVGGAQTGSQDEYVSFISQREYQETKQRLKDPGFVRQLETHSITIIDTRGNSYGAKKGDVKFLDDEVRFVRQNKK